MDKTIPAPVLSAECIDNWLSHHTTALDRLLMNGHLTQETYNIAMSDLNSRYESYIEALALYDRIQAKQRK